jgi:hypothetical protein
VSDKAVFPGGWIELKSLLQHLGGWPLQADLDETFTPADGGPGQRRQGRIFVDRQRRVRIEFREEGHPAILCLCDPHRALMVMGLVDEPATRVQVPWMISLPPLSESAAGEPPQVAIDMEVRGAAGSHRYRLFNARYEDPEERLFAEQ